MLKLNAKHPKPDVVRHFRNRVFPPKPQTVPKPSKILRLLQDPSPSPPPQETGARLKTTQKKKKSWTSAALEGSLEGIKSSLTPRAVKCLKAPPGWEDWEQGKKLRRGLAGSDYLTKWWVGTEELIKSQDIPLTNNKEGVWTFRNC